MLGNTLGGTVGDNETPASQTLLELGGDAVQLSAGRAHTCALLEDQSVRCWGLGSEGALGYASVENVGDDETPAEQGAVEVGGAVIQISAGSDHTRALLDDESVRCWGRGTNGQLGYGNTESIGDNETPGSLATPVDVGGPVRFLDAGASHTCAALMSGALRCWGDGFGDKLGYGDTESIGDNETPASAGDLDW